MSFAHLHVHSEFSLLDGAIKVADLCKRAVELGQTAVAVTDHGWLAGAVKFTQAAQKAGIKPIIGMETYVAANDDHTTPAKSGGDNYHLTLLARNETGYRNLSRLTSAAHLRGLSYKPRIDNALLADHADGLVVLSGCIGAEIPQRIMAGETSYAAQLAAYYQDITGGHFYIEVMNHGAHNGVDHIKQVDDLGRVIMTETDLNMALVDIANKLGIGVVATNDAHYLKKENGDHHDTLLCLSMGAWKDKPDRMRFHGAEHRAWDYYIKSDAEMQAMSKAGWWQTACANTQLVADSIEQSVVPMGGLIMPNFIIPDDPGYAAWKASRK